MSTKYRQTLTLLIVAAFVIVAGMSPDTRPENDQLPGEHAIIAGDRLRVLVVENTDDRMTLPRSQQIALASQTWRSKIGEFNGELLKVEPDQDVSNLPKAWQDAVKLASGNALPFWIVSNAPQGRGVAGPFPLTYDKATEVVAQIGGAQ